MRYDRLPYERIRNLRNDKNLTQQNVADMLGIKQNTYSQYELGILKYPITILIKLAEFHGTSVDYLLDLTNNPVPYERSASSKRKE